MKTLHLMIGDRCNNNCIFCMESRHRKVDDIKRQKETLSKKGFSRVVFTSGEPTISDDLFEAAASAKDYGYDERMVITNGRRLSNMSYLRKMVDSGINMIGVSIHGPCARLHDAMTRTPGSFEQTMKGINNVSLIRRMIRGFTLHITATALNVEELRKTYEMIRGFGADDIIINMFNPKDNMQGRAELMPRYTDVADQVAGYNVTLVDIPCCISRSSGLIEDFHIRSDGEQISYDRENLEGKMMLLSCKSCKNPCQGISDLYVRKYGKDEFRHRC